MERAAWALGLAEMRNQIVFVAFLVALLTGCSSDKDEDSRDEGSGKSGDSGQHIKVPIFTKQKVPSSRRWRKAREKVAPRLVKDLDQKGLSYGAPIFVRIFKEEMELEVWGEANRKFELFRLYNVAACSGKLGPKLAEGDQQAPEGFYYVTPSRMNPHSRFHLSFDLGYPNGYDRTHGRTGSALMVHGGNVSIGCFAMTDAKIEEIYGLAEAALGNGQRFFRVHCFPFRMSEDNMKRHHGSKWYAFWQNLKEGYDFFEETKRPPNVVVRNNRYSFEMEDD